MNFTKHSKTTHPSQLFQKNNTGEVRFSNSFYEVSITLALKSNKDITRKENYGPMYMMNTEAKIILKNTGRGENADNCN